MEMKPYFQTFFETRLMHWQSLHSTNALDASNNYLSVEFSLRLVV
jgi:hypothetical protein